MSLERNLNDPISEHMRADYACLHIAQSVDESLAAIRATPPRGRIIYFYVVDDENRLRGVVPTRRLLLSPGSAIVADLMDARVIAIPCTASVLEACEFFLLHRLLAFPVVGADGYLMGVVDVQLYTDELTDLDRREGSDDLFQLIGVHVTDVQQASSVAAFRSRFPWLLANIAGGVLAAFMAGFFEAELQKAVALAMFVPVVLALSESVSIQSVSLALQSLHGRQPTWRSIFFKLRIESVTGLLLGTASALTVALVAVFWLRQYQVILCLLGGIAGGVTCAALIGVAIPNFLRLLNREPQVAAGPVALATTDIVTLLFYFVLARWVLN